MVSAIDKPSQVPLVVLSGGGGGARLAAALSKCTAQRPVIVVTNTGDDFEHLGLLICPDTDSVLYATSGKLDRARGWGREGESWQVLDAIQAMAGPSWFQLGDKDLALHLLRAEQLRKGCRFGCRDAGFIRTSRCPRGHDCHPRHGAIRPDTGCDGGGGTRVSGILCRSPL